VRDEIRLLPLLLLYAGFVLVAAVPGLEGDEARYVMFATNLSQGFYSPPGQVDLANGPGYPIVLVPFVLADAPSILPRLLNALFLFAAMVYAFHTIRLYAGRRRAFLATSLLGLYVPFFRYLHMMLTETLAVMLVCGFAFHFCMSFREESAGRHGHILGASWFLGWLMLTKVMFGYIVTLGLLIGLVIYAVWKDSGVARVCRICVLALLICVPFLFYTFHVTGKPFYWGTYGGSALYWMSTPYEGEYGDWKANRLDQLLKSGRPALIENHRDLFEETAGLDQVEWDTRLKRAALRNIRDHPFKYLRNWFANVGRLLFNYPFSYEPLTARTLFYVLPNTILLVLLVFSIAPGWAGRGGVPLEIRALMLFVALAFATHSLVAVSARQALLLVPLIVLWITFAASRPTMSRWDDLAAGPKDEMGRQALMHGSPAGRQRERRHLLHAAQRLDPLTAESRMSP